MKNQKVFVKGTGTGTCIEEACEMILVEFKHAIAWIDLRRESVEVVA